MKKWVVVWDYSKELELKPVQPLKVVDPALFARCFEQLRGEMICQVGSPCGPFYKDRSEECVAFRKDVDSQSSSKTKAHPPVQRTATPAAR